MNTRQILAVIATIAVVLVVLAVPAFLIYKLAVKLGGPEIPPETLLHKAQQSQVEWAFIYKKKIFTKDHQPGFFAGRFKTPVKPEQADRLEKALRQHGAHVFKLPPWWVWIMVFGAFAAVVEMWERGVTDFNRSALVASLYVFLLWLCHAAMRMPADVSGFSTLAAMRFKLFESGWIPFAILWTFFAGLHYLFLLWRAKLAPLSENRQDNAEILRAVESNGGKEAAEERQAAMEEILDKQGSRNFFSKLLNQVRNRFEHDADLPSVISYKNELLEIEEERMSLYFVAVRWCEVALPLLGFLGTVVGVGGAIGSVSSGVGTLFAGKPMASALDDLNLGFKGLGLAFDTTFLGLAGLIVLGILHMAIKKGLASSLARARHLLTEFVYRWSSGDAVLVALGGINVQLKVSEKRLLALEEAVRSSDRRATEFRETAELLVQQVIREDPQFKSIRKVLFYPEVAFQEVGAGLLKEMRKYLNDQLGSNWRLRAMGISNSRSGVLTVENGNGERWMLRFGLGEDVNGPHYPIATELRELLPFPDSNVILGVAQPGDLLSLSVNGNDLHNVGLEKQIESDDRILPVIFESQQRTLVLCRIPDSAKTEAFLSDGRSLDRLGQLPEQHGWTCFAAHAESATLFAVGRSLRGGPDRLLVTRLTRPPEPEDGKKRRPAAQRRVVLDDFRQFLDLPRDLKPAQIVAVSQESALILDTTGALHYWDTSRTEPKRLAVPSWSADCVICPGRGGWIAVAQSEMLSMWQVQRGGWIHRYDESPAEHKIEPVDPKSFRATLDGRYLFAIGAQGLFTWEFPKYAVEA